MSDQDINRVFNCCPDCYWKSMKKIFISSKSTPLAWREGRRHLLQIVPHLYRKTKLVTSPTLSEAHYHTEPATSMTSIGQEWSLSWTEGNRIINLLTPASSISHITTTTNRPTADRSPFTAHRRFALRKPKEVATCLPHFWPNQVPLRFTDLCQPGQTTIVRYKSWFLWQQSGLRERWKKTSKRIPLARHGHGVLLLLRGSFGRTSEGTPVHCTSPGEVWVAGLESQNFISSDSLKISQLAKNITPLMHSQTKTFQKVGRK